MAQLTKTEEYTDQKTHQRRQLLFRFRSINKEPGICHRNNKAIRFSFFLWKLLSIQTTRFEFPVKKK